ncbi:hypothetical protein JNJ66_04315 [Candidatus Saccharibacteria bacterium]|nr:hypothetical protein [Candidatus Saccharibacteria bacterium]
MSTPALLQGSEFVEIFHATRRLFADGGTVRLSDVANEVGLSYGRVRGLFGTVEGLLASAYYDQVVGLCEELGWCLCDVGPQSALTLLVKRLCSERHRPLVRAMVRCGDLQLKGQSESMASRLYALIEGCILQGRNDGSIAPGIDPDLLIRYFMAGALQAILSWSPSDSEGLEDFLLDQMPAVFGLRPPEPHAAPMTGA